MLLWLLRLLRVRKTLWQSVQTALLRGWRCCCSLCLFRVSLVLSNLPQTSHRWQALTGNGRLIPLNAASPAHHREHTTTLSQLVNHLGDLGLFFFLLRVQWLLFFINIFLFFIQISHHDHDYEFSDRNFYKNHHTRPAVNVARCPDDRTDKFVFYDNKNVRIRTIT